MLWYCHVRCRTNYVNILLFFHSFKFNFWLDLKTFHHLHLIHNSFVQKEKTKQKNTPIKQNKKQTTNVLTTTTTTKSQNNYTALIILYTTDLLLMLVYKVCDRVDGNHIVGLAQKTYRLSSVILGLLIHLKFTLLSHTTSSRKKREKAH